MCGAGSCEWITRGHQDYAGQPTIRSAADCKGALNTTTRRIMLEETDGRGGSPPSPRHCPAQQPGTCPEGVSVSQRRKVAELAARTGCEKGLFWATFIDRSFCPDRLGANISKIHSKRRRFSQGCASVGIGGDDVRAGGSLAGARAKRVAKPAQPRLATGGMMKLFLFGSRSAAGAGQLVFPPDTALCCRCCHTAPMTTLSMALATSAPINAQPSGSK
jgi:hypothetical protein